MILVISSCASRRDEAVPPSHGTPAPRESFSSNSSHTAASPAWADEGAVLIAMKKAHKDEIVPYNDWAYQSAPVNIDGDGVYVLSFVVPASFSLVGPDGVGGLALKIPPDAAFSVRPKPPFSTTTDSNGSVTLSVPVVVQDFRQPYPGFSAWAY